MPSGRYSIIGEDGDPVGTETFRCAPGPFGWRYVSEIETIEHGQHHEVVDIAVDDRWRIVRLRVDSGEHRLRLEPAGGFLVGERDGDPIELPYGADDHVDYLTPVTNLITTRRLDGTAEIDVVFVEPFTLDPVRERQRYERKGAEIVETPVGRFEAVRWVYTSLGIGWTSDLWVAGDVLVKYRRLFELVAYDPGGSGPAPLP